MRFVNTCCVLSGLGVASSALRKLSRGRLGRRTGGTVARASHTLPICAPEVVSTPLLRKAAGCALLSQNPPERGLTVLQRKGASVPQWKPPRPPGSRSAPPSDLTRPGLW